MDKLLDGIGLLKRNAIGISNQLDDVHTKIIINLDKVEHNDSELKKNQKRI
jgi:hypothetical protein